jgi:hypothetical protein
VYIEFDAIAFYPHAAKIDHVSSVALTHERFDDLRKGHGVD